MLPISVMKSRRFIAKPLAWEFEDATVHGYGFSFKEVVQSLVTAHAKSPQAEKFLVIRCFLHGGHLPRRRLRQRKARNQPQG
jgi:hypothetical protein